MPIQLPRANLSANLQGAVAIDENTLTSVLIENLNGNLTARLNHEISALTADSHARFHAIETTLTNLNAKLDHLLNASAILAFCQNPFVPETWASSNIRCNPAMRQIM